MVSVCPTLSVKIILRTIIKRTTRGIFGLMRAHVQGTHVYTRYWTIHSNWRKNSNRRVIVWCAHKDQGATLGTPFKMNGKWHDLVLSDPKSTRRRVGRFSWKMLMLVLDFSWVRFSSVVFVREKLKIVDIDARNIMKKSKKHGNEKVWVARESWWMHKSWSWLIEMHVLMKKLQMQEYHEIQSWNWLI